MTLYEMTQTANELYALLENEEIDEQTVADTLEGIGVEGKIEDYCKVIRQFEGEAEMFKAEADKLEKKVKRAVKNAEKLEKALLLYFSATNTEKAKAGIFELSVTKSKAANIIDEGSIPAEYRIVQPDKIDKASIRKALMNGETVSGAELQINQSLKIK